jgi:hypothetical protein
MQKGSLLASTPYQLSFVEYNMRICTRHGSCDCKETAHTPGTPPSDDLSKSGAKHREPCNSEQAMATTVAAAETSSSISTKEGHIVWRLAHGKSASPPDPQATDLQDTIAIMEKDKDRAADVECWPVRRCTKL